MACPSPAREARRGPRSDEDRIGEDGDSDLDRYDTIKDGKIHGRIYTEHIARGRGCW